MAEQETISDESKQYPPKSAEENVPLGSEIGEKESTTDKTTRDLATASKGGALNTAGVTQGNVIDHRPSVNNSDDIPADSDGQRSQSQGDVVGPSLSVINSDDIPADSKCEEGTSTESQGDSNKATKSGEDPPTESQGDSNKATRSGEDTPTESQCDNYKKISIPDDIPEILRSKKLPWCCGHYYVCKWEAFKKPGVYNFLKWKICEPSHPIPSNEVLDTLLPVLPLDVSKISQPPVNGIQVTWIGHATMLVQMEGLTILTDPVLDTFCGPIRLFSYKRHRNAACQVKDIPHLDAVLISHTHYDHLETKAVREIIAKFPKVHWFVAGGTRKWFQSMGCTDENVTELDWWEGIEFKGVKFICTPSQHWCQRCVLDFNKCLWCSWVVKGPKHSFYFAGDTGYFDELFQKIGQKYGPFDLAGIPIGAYIPRYITAYGHVNPEEAVQLHADINSKMSIGIHWGAFELTNEHFLEPPVKVKEEMVNAERDCKEFISINIGETWVVGEDRVESPLFMELPFMKDVVKSNDPCSTTPKEDEAQYTWGSWNGEYVEQSFPRGILP